MMAAGIFSTADLEIQKIRNSIRTPSITKISERNLAEMLMRFKDRVTSNIPIENPIYVSDVELVEIALVRIKEIVSNLIDLDRVEAEIFLYFVEARVSDFANYESRLTDSAGT